MSSPSTNDLMERMLQMLAHQQKIIDDMARQRMDAPIRVEGLKLPTYSGRIEESARLFYEQMNQYFLARGTDWNSSTISRQVLAILGSALRGPAAQWYAIRQHDIRNVEEFFYELDK